jgi:cellulose synthase/poly-beta-1,6-N-acetylglucosamine synthase-like glycosyltransferase
MQDEITLEQSAPGVALFKSDSNGNRFPRAIAAPALEAQPSNGDATLKTPRRSNRRRKPRPTVSLVIPAKNEARNLASVLEEIPGCVNEVILVDGQSSDSTRLMATSCYPGVRIITDPEMGKGNALRAGFQAARGDIIVAIDADGSMDPREIPSFLYFLENGYDFVKGSRFIGGGGSLDITLFRRVGNRALLMVANHLFPVQLTDLCYGFFAFRRKYLEHLDLSSTGFEIETELTVRAVQAGMRIAEVPSLEMPRRSGRSSLRSVPDGYRVLQTLLREWRDDPAAGSRQRPLRSGVTSHNGSA